MIYTLIFDGYLGLLSALSVWMMIEGAQAMRRTVLTMVAVLLTCFAYLMAFGAGEDYSGFAIAADAVACWIITYRPAGKWQSVIGLSYILQIGVHVGRLAANNPDMNIMYWETTMLAFLQLFLLGAWWFDEKPYSPRRKRRADLHAPAAGPAGVD